MPDARLASPRWWSVAVAGGTLAVAVGLQGLHVFRETASPVRVPLGALLPERLPGWYGRDVPLGPNEFLSAEAEKVLNFDEAVNRVFLRGSENFGLYVAHWGAGKMPVRLVASHTPDRCWTENGWRCLQMKFRQPESVDGRGLQPAEWRVFEPPAGGQPTYLLYWHLVNGRVYDYGSRFNAVPDPVRWWRDALHEALHGNQEQYFIRLTSSRPLENLRDDPGFQEVLRRLAALGLAAPLSSTAHS